jgi:hypothetical protein
MFQSSPLCYFSCLLLLACRATLPEYGNADAISLWTDFDPCPKTSLDWEIADLTINIYTLKTIDLNSPVLEGRCLSEHIPGHQRKVY